MKSCPYCGRENNDETTHCGDCGTQFQEGEELDPVLTDPGAELVPVATFGDLLEATLLKTKLEAAGIEACIPEDFASNPFGNFIPLAHVTVQVAATNLDPAKAIVADMAALEILTDRVAA